MNNPILVREPSEWGKLAPALEKQGYPMPHGFTYNDTPNLPTVVRLGSISWSSTDLLDWARPQGEVLLSVDEYLKELEQSPSHQDYGLLKIHAESLQTRLNACEAALAERDAKLGKVSEALAEIERERNVLIALDEEINEPECYTKAKGLERAKKILTSKLNQE